MYEIINGRNYLMERYDSIHGYGTVRSKDMIIE
jgi:hypothetical protein